MKRYVPLALFVSFLVGCSLFPPRAQGATVVISWVNPVTNTDDTPIPTAQGEPEALQAWRIEYGSCTATGEFGIRIGEFTRTRATLGPALESATQNLPPGQKCFRVYVSNTFGVESGASNVAAREVPAATPRPPTNVTATLQGS